MRLIGTALAGLLLSSLVSCGSEPEPAKPENAGKTNREQLQSTHDSLQSQVKGIAPSTSKDETGAQQ